jgi:hypothetical protein
MRSGGRRPALESIGVSVVQGGVERIDGHRGVSIKIKKVAPSNVGNIGNVIPELSARKNNLSESVRI